MEEILEKARRVASEAEVFAVSFEETPVQFEANRLKSIQSKQGTTVSLRLIKEGRTGHATATHLDDAQGLVDMAVATAQFGMAARFTLPSLTKYPKVDVYDPEVASFPLERMIGLGDELIARVTGHTPGIICEATTFKEVASVSMINSRGGQASYRASVFSLGVMGTLIRDTDMLFVGEGQSSCHPLTTTGDITDTVIWQLEHAREIAPVATRRLPVVFTPAGVAGTLLPPLMMACNGKTVLQGASPIGRRLGETVFAKILSVWDDATIAYRPHSRPCDDEGIPSQRTPLVEQGRVAGFLYDLQTAALAGTRSTGSGHRSGGLPAPAPSALVVAPGTTTFEEMISGMKEGLVIEQLMGADQGNTLGGDFSGNVLLGYKVESGKIVGRVKDTMVSGNIYQALKKGIVIGREPRWVGGSVSTPHIYIPRLAVASR